jgi:DNA-binding NarL/FixJ family response regulator
MPANDAIRILVVDDHPVLRRGLTAIIHACADMRVAVASPSRSHMGRCPSS